MEEVVVEVLRVERGDVEVGGECAPVRGMPSNTPKRPLGCDTSVLRVGAFLAAPLASDRRAAGILSKADRYRHVLG